MFRIIFPENDTKKCHLCFFGSVRISSKLFTISICHLRKLSWYCFFPSYVRTCCLDRFFVSDLRSFCPSLGLYFKSELQFLRWYGITDLSSSYSDPEPTYGHSSSFPLSYSYYEVRRVWFVWWKSAYGYLSVRL